MKTKRRDTEKEKRGRTGGGKMYKDRERGNRRQNGEVGQKETPDETCTFHFPCPSAAHHLARLCLGAKAQPLGGPSLSKTQVNPLIPALETQRQPLQLGADQGAAEGLGMRGPHGQTLSPQ